MTDGHERYAAAAGFHLDRPDGDELIVLLHGLGADHRQPLDLLTGMDPRTAAVLAPDARAHGATAVIGERPDFRFDALVRDLVTLVRRLGQSGKPVHLVGVSMGAAIALRAALAPVPAVAVESRTPDAAFPVRSLTLIRPAFDQESLPANLRVMAQIGHLLRRHDPARARIEFVAGAAYREVAAVSGLAAASLLTQFDDPRAAARSVRLRGVPRNTAYTGPAELASVGVPTLVIGTERDPVHPIRLAREWTAAIPTATFAAIPPRDDDPVASTARLRELVQLHLAAHLAA